MTDIPPLQFRPPRATLVAFRDGSYKRVRPVKWRHTQWIHFTLADGSEINPANVNYLHIGIEPEDGDK